MPAVASGNARNSRRQSQWSHFVVVALFVLGGILGASLASFCGVLAYRMPRGLSALAPRSACASCATFIAWYDNVPVASWLVLRGSCRACSARLPVALIAFEVAGAVVGAAATYALVRPPS